jgi:hypothetical protein
VCLTEGKLFIFGLLKVILSIVEGIQIRIWKRIDSRKVQGVSKRALKLYSKCYCVASVMKRLNLKAYKLSIVEDAVVVIVATVVTVVVLVIVVVVAAA